MHINIWGKSRSWYAGTCVVLLLGLIVLQLAYIHRVPGLMGDEASEGENVWQLLDTKELTVRGERSYIGPVIDYVRVPFIQLFGYTALALRLPLVIASAVSFAMAAALFRRWFGEVVALYALVGIFYSPIYLSQQRLAWAIALSPFFALAVIWLGTRPWRQAPLLAGLVGGLGLSNHLLFLPTLVGLACVRLLTLARHPRQLLTWWPAVIGFLAGFGTQLAILILYPEDQGDPSAVGALVGERWQGLWGLLPLLISGSSYVARYTGNEFSVLSQLVATIVLGVSGVAALILPRSRRVAGMMTIFLLVHLSVLLYLIDRYSLRYFSIVVFTVSLLAGIGLGAILEYLWRQAPWRHGVIVLLLALMLTGVYLGFILVPFLNAGGSVNTFSLANRTDSAAALVDIRPLIACIAGIGPVGSENVHIWNRLQFVGHAHSDIEVVPEESLALAEWVVTYRLENQLPDERERCPELRHFVVLPTSN